MLGVIALVATIAGVLVVNASRGQPDPGTSPGPAISQAPRSEAPILPPPPAGITYRDYIYATTVVEHPSASRAGSKLWYAADAWWAGLHQPATDRIMIFRLDPATQLWTDTGALVDERPFADPDFLWTGEHLYVVSAGHTSSQRHEGRLLRYRLADDGTRFVLDPNYPVTVMPTGTTAATVAVDTEGVVWVAYVADGRVRMVHSLEHDAHWSAPMDLPVEHAAVDPEDIASVVAFGPGRIGVAWTNQLDHSVYFATHADGDAPETWSPTETVVAGAGAGDERLELKSYPLAGDETGVVIATRTVNDDAPPSTDLAPLIQLLVRDAQGAWNATLVSQVRDKQARPIVLVDADARMFYVAATTPARGGAITYKRSPIDAVSFESGPGEPLVASPTDLAIGDANSTRQPLTAATGMVVLAADEDTGRYLHGVVDLGGGPPTADPADPGRPDRPAAAEGGGPARLIDNDFEPWAPGDAAGTSWLTREGDAPDALSIVDDGDDGRALQIGGGEGGTGVRACRSLPVAGPSRLIVDLRVRASGVGTADSAILSLRGPGGEAATVRVSERGEFAWFDGPTKVRTTPIFEADTWYRVHAVVDQVAKTYAFTISPDRGDPIVERSGIDWRDPAVPAVGDICLETAVGAPDLTIDLADARVLQETAP